MGLLASAAYTKGRYSSFRNVFEGNRNERVRKDFGTTSAVSHTYHGVTRRGFTFTGTHANHWETRRVGFPLFSSTRSIVAHR